MQRGRKRIDWEEKARVAGFKSINDAFARHINSGGIYTTKNLAHSLDVSNMALLLELKRRGKKVPRAGAPSGNTNNKFDLRCDLFGFSSDEDMLKAWKKDGLSGRAIADRISKVFERKISFSTIHKRLRKIKSLTKGK